MRLILPLAALALIGCAGSFEEAKVSAQGLKVGAIQPSPECRGLDDGHRNWSAVAVGSGALAGVSGLASIPSYDSKELRIGLASGAVAMGALAVAATKESDGFAESWARECSGK